MTLLSDQRDFVYNQLKNDFLNRIQDSGLGGSDASAIAQMLASYMIYSYRPNLEAQFLAKLMQGLTPDL